LTNKKQQKTKILWQTRNKKTNNKIAFYLSSRYRKFKQPSGVIIKLLHIYSTCQHMQGLILQISLNLSKYQAVVVS